MSNLSKETTLEKPELGSLEKSSPPFSHQEIVWDWFLKEVTETQDNLQEAKKSLEDSHKNLIDLDKKNENKQQDIIRELTSARKDIKRTAMRFEEVEKRLKPEYISEFIISKQKSFFLVLAMVSSLGSFLGGSLIVSIFLILHSL